MLLKRFWKLFLTTACAQVNIPNAHIEGVLFPNFVCLALDSRNESAVRVRAMPTSVLELYRESVESIYMHRKLNGHFVFIFHLLPASLHDECSQELAYAQHCVTCSQTLVKVCTMLVHCLATAQTQAPCSDSSQSVAFQSLLFHMEALSESCFDKFVKNHALFLVRILLNIMWNRL